MIPLHATRAVQNTKMFWEFHILLNLIPDVRKGTNTIVFIIRGNIPFDRLKDVTYERICANYRPKKDDPNCSRLTIGGDRLNVPKDSGTPTVDMVTVKLHLNSVISTKGAHYCTTLTSKISTS